MTAKLEAMTRAQQASAGKPIESYPIRLFVSHLAEIFGVSVKRCYELDAAGEFMFAEIKPRIGRKSWSRDRVAACFAGEVRGLRDVSAKRSA